MRFELKEGRERKREKETPKTSGTTELIRCETRHRFFEGRHFTVGKVRKNKLPGERPFQFERDKNAVP